MTVCVPVCPIYALPDIMSEYTDELLYGEEAEVIDELGSFYRIKTEYGYCGWVAKSDLFEKRPRLLHVAPEVCLMRHLRRAYKVGGNAVDYVTADLESPLADLHFDIQLIPLADESFDVIFCNHIMEHVEDDRRAMRELYRVMRRGGWGVVLSPVELDRATTFEDDSITDEAERTRIFGQYDHRRVYGRDYADRLREAGFEVEDLDYAASLSDDERARYALPADHLYIVRKR